MKNELKRRDKIMIILFFLSTFVMYVANPSNLDIRSVAWDVSMAIVFLSLIFWLIAEIGDQLSGMVIGDIPYKRKDKIVQKNVSRIELLDMACEATGVHSDSLDHMSDIELETIVQNNGTPRISGDPASLNVIVITIYGILVKFVAKIRVFLQKKQSGKLSLPDEAK